MFLMATLPAQINAAELLPAALARKVAYVPGEEFHLEGSGRNTLRLNFSNARPDQIERGIRLLGEMVAEAGQARPRPPKGAAVTFAT
jgi:2-aminoadipate transaminase